MNVVKGNDAGKDSYKMLKTTIWGLGMGIYAFNPNYSEGGNRRILGKEGKLG
jgi:hypothetical protein